MKNLFKQSIGRALERTLRAITLGSIITASSVANAAGLMSPVSSNLPALEIRSHDVLVTIEDGYAVTQPGIQHFEYSTTIAPAPCFW